MVLSSYFFKTRKLNKYFNKTENYFYFSVNFPPVFPSATQYYALFQETLELAIDISDPEGLPVTVSLEGNSNEAVMHQNVLRWNVSSKSSTLFSLKATDACQASATLNITVHLDDCQCKNGSCVPHPNKPRGSGFYECNCLPGFSGSKCETNIDDCQSSPCLRGIILSTFSV